MHPGSLRYSCSSHARLFECRPAIVLEGHPSDTGCFAGVLNQRKDATLTIVGAGPAEQWLKARAERLGYKRMP